LMEQDDWTNMPLGAGSHIDNDDLDQKTDQHSR
jgi:hypothetical protein